MGTSNTTQFIHGELTREIIGALFEVHNTLGPGLLEKHYQKALAEEFTKRGIPFVEQYTVSLDYKGVVIGRYYLDFFVYGKIPLEIKRDVYFSRKQIEQTLNYLKALNLQLGLLVHFGKMGVKFKRIVNIS